MNTLGFEVVQLNSRERKTCSIAMRPHLEAPSVEHGCPSSSKCFNGRLRLWKRCLTFQASLRQPARFAREALSQWAGRSRRHATSAACGAQVQTPPSTAEDSEVLSEPPHNLSGTSLGLTKLGFRVAVAGLHLLQAHNSNASSTLPEACLARVGESCRHKS